MINQGNNLSGLDREMLQIIERNLSLKQNIAGQSEKGNEGLENLCKQLVMATPQADKNFREGLEVRLLTKLEAAWLNVYGNRAEETSNRVDTNSERVVKSRAWNGSKQQIRKKVEVLELPLEPEEDFIAVPFGRGRRWRVLTLAASVVLVVGLMGMLLLVTVSHAPETRVSTVVAGVTTTPVVPKEDLPQPPNLDFENGLQAWNFRSNFGDTPPPGLEGGVDHTVVHGGATSGYIKAKTNIMAFLEHQPITDVVAYKGKRVQMSAYVKTQGADAVNLWIQAEGDGKGLSPLAYDNMRNRAIVGTSEWKKYELVIDIPSETVSIGFGMTLTGQGEVWLDDVHFEAVDSTVATTGVIVLPQPSNLDFRDELQGWDCCGGSGYAAGIDNAVRNNGNVSGYVKVIGRTVGFGNLMHRAVTDIGIYKGKRVRMSAYIKTQGVEQKASLYVGISGPNYKDLGVVERGIRGTNDWKLYEVVFDVPPEAVNFTFGVNLSGNGQVWVNGIHFEGVDKTVPMTR